MIEWQSESSLFTLRVRGRQWYWVYKLDLRTIGDIFSVPRNIGRNRWQCSTFSDLQTADDYLHLMQLRAGRNFYQLHLKELGKEFLSKDNVKVSTPLEMYRSEVYKNQELVRLISRLSKNLYVTDLSKNKNFSDTFDCFPQGNLFFSNPLGFEDNLLRIRKKNWKHREFFVSELPKIKNFLKKNILTKPFFLNTGTELKSPNSFWYNQLSYSTNCNNYIDILKNPLERNWVFIKRDLTLKNTTEYQINKKLTPLFFSKSHVPKDLFLTLKFLIGEPSTLGKINVPCSDINIPYNNLNKFYLSNFTDFLISVKKQVKQKPTFLLYDNKYISKNFVKNRPYKKNSEGILRRSIILHPEDIYLWRWNKDTETHYKNFCDLTKFLGPDKEDKKKKYLKDFRFLALKKGMFVGTKAIHYPVDLKPHTNHNEFSDETNRIFSPYKTGYSFHAESLLKFSKRSILGINGTDISILKSSEIDDICREIKKSFGKCTPIRVLKRPITNIFFKETLLEDKDVNLLKFRFHSLARKSLLGSRPVNDHTYLTFKQKRYNLKKRIMYDEKHFFKDAPHNTKNFIGKGETPYSVNPFLKNKATIEVNLDKEAATTEYRLIKKSKSRLDTTRVAGWNRLLRSRRVLVLPAHINITVITNSFDVVHSWHIPGLGLKMDCLPGRATHHTLYIDNVGLYYGQCAEVCGRYHHHMPIRVCALPFEHFLVWWHTFGLPKFLFAPSDHKTQLYKDRLGGSDYHIHSAKYFNRKFSW